MRLFKRRASVVLAIPLAALGAPAAHGERVGAAAALFQQKCAACHDSAGWGTRALSLSVPPSEAELSVRKGLTSEYVRYVVRHGIGSMPPFTPTDLSDTRLGELATWLQRGR